MKKIFTLTCTFALAMTVIVAGLSVSGMAANAQITNVELNVSTSVKSTSTQAKINATSTANRAAEHRSDVAVFVQTLRSSADRIGGIGEDVRAVAREQASSSAKIAVAVEKIEARGSFKTFLVGSDYKNIGTVRSELVQMENRLSRLSRDLENLPPSADKAAIQAELELMQENQLKLETFIKARESAFSLFGWLARIFQK